MKKIFSRKESVAILKKKLGPAERRKAHNSVVLLIKGEKLERGMHKQKEKSTDQESQRPPASDMSREGWRSLTSTDKPTSILVSLLACRAVGE